MIDLLVATVAFVVVVAVLLVGAVLVTVAPMYVALQLADARRFTTTRWAAVTAVGILVGLGYAYRLHAGDLPKAVQLLPLALCWAGPAALWLLDGSQARIGGRAGRHE